MKPEDQPSARAAAPELELPTGQDSEPRPRKPLTWGKVALLVAAMLLAVGLFIVAAAMLILSNPSGSYACTSSGQRALAGKEGFVRAHLGDATAFEVATYSCDSGSAAFLQFGTRLNPTAARAAFLSDAECSLDRDEVGDVSVVCGTGAELIDLFFEASSDGTTSGTLWLGEWAYAELRRVSTKL